MVRKKVQWTSTTARDKVRQRASERRVKSTKILMSGIPTVEDCRMSLEEVEELGLDTSSPKVPESSIDRVHVDKFWHYYDNSERHFLQLQIGDLVWAGDHLGNDDLVVYRLRDIYGFLPKGGGRLTPAQADIVAKTHVTPAIYIDDRHTYAKVRVPEGGTAWHHFKHRVFLYQGGRVAVRKYHDMLHQHEWSKLEQAREALESTSKKM